MAFRPKHIVFILLAALWLSVGNSWADVPTPRVKPPAPKITNLLPKNEAKDFKSALSAANRRSWSSVEKYRDRIQDPVAKDILYWIQAVRDPNASVAEMSYVINNLSDWPRVSSIQAKAEYKIFDSPKSASETVSWFAGREPVSGEGRAALANAYYSLGDTANGDQWLKLAWREAKLTRDRQKRIYQKHKDRLSSDDHAARGDHLIWEGTTHFSKVDGLLSLMPAADKAVSVARMRLLRNRSGIDSAVSRVPNSHASDTGLLYARAKWRRQKRSKEYALEPYLQIIDP